MRHVGTDSDTRTPRLPRPARAGRRHCAASKVAAATAIAAILGTLSCGDSGTELGPQSSVATTLLVSPATTALTALDEIVQLTAEVRDQNGRQMESATVTWSSSDVAVATVGPTGLVTAVANGSTMVTASSGSASADAQVSVEQQVAGVQVSPSSTTLASLGDTVRLAAEGVDANGNPVATVEFSWSSDDSAVAAVSPTGLVTAMANGSAMVTASSGSASADAQVSVEQQVAGVQVSPSSTTLASLGDTVRLAAEGVDANGNPVATVEFSWSSDDSAVAAVSPTGLVTAMANGSAMVTASSGSASADAQVSVEQQVAGVQVSPSSTTLASLGDTVRLAAEGVDANGNPVATVEFSWSSDDSAVAAVGPTGLVTAMANGSAMVTASSGSASGRCSGLGRAAGGRGPGVALLDDARIARGHRASGRRGRGRERQPCGDRRIQLVFGRLDGGGGWPHGPGHGDGQWLGDGDREFGLGLADAQVSVEQQVAGVQVSPSSTTLASLGDTVRLAAEGVDANGNPVATVEFSWSSDDSAVAAVSPTGLVTAMANGSAMVTASSGSASADAQVSVEQQVAGVQVSPSSTTLASLGDTVRLAAEGVDANGNPVATVEFSWSSDDSAVAAVSPTGLVTAMANGSAMVTASSGSASADAQVSVEQQVAGVQVSPSSTTLASLGDTVRLAAEGVDANGNPVATVEFSWSSDDSAVAAVGPTGLVTAMANGSATVTVSFEGVGAMASVAVVDVAQFLAEHARVADAMEWLGRDSQYRPYVTWPQRMKEKLVLAVIALVGEGNRLPDVMINLAAGSRGDDDHPLTVVSPEDAEDVYVANIAYSLLIDMTGILPWSLDDLSDRELEMLLGSQGFFSEYGSIAGVSEGYMVAGMTAPAPPEVIRDFLENNDLVRGNRYETIARTVEWTRHHLTHYSCLPSTSNMENHWDYRGIPPLARMFAGTKRKPWQSPSGCRTGADQSAQRYTWGCHGTAWFFIHVLRAVNIPVEAPRTYYAVCAGHATVSFPSEDVYLSHGDDPYNRFTWYSPPFPEPFPSSDLLISGSRFREWFNSSHSNEENRWNVGRRVRELAVENLPQLLLHWRCLDLADGLPKESGRVYRPGSSGIGRDWTVAELEAMGFWERMDAKIAEYGGCPIPHPERWPNQWSSATSSADIFRLMDEADILRGVMDEPAPGFHPASHGEDVCWFDPRYLTLAPSSRNRRVGPYYASPGRIGPG